MTFIPQILLILWRVWFVYNATYLPIKRLKSIHTWAVSDWGIFYDILFAFVFEFSLFIVLWWGGFF